MKHIAWFSLLLLLLVHTTLAQRTHSLLSDNWRFLKADADDFHLPNYNDAHWQKVSIPHDWAIYGPFSSKNDVQDVAILQDGQTDAMEHAGRTGGLPFVGVGWYRRDIQIDKHDIGKRFFLIFDGAMSEPKIYINGNQAGEWKYGYNSFIIDATPYLQKGKNLLAVRLENLPESSRWYPGAGLYRNVHLIALNDNHLTLWGQQIITEELTDEFARLSIKTEVTVPEPTDRSNLRLEVKIFSPDGSLVAHNDGHIYAYGSEVVRQEIQIPKPQCWSVEHPTLYNVETKLYIGKHLHDTHTDQIGIRKIELRQDEGFFLNGKQVIFKGVCNHHDLGPLGAAVNDAAIRRQIRLLKDMGCNAIRTSHNMPAPELVKACDEMGMMLMAESFDEWQIAKCKNGYNRFFHAWAERDLTNLIRHYQNSPSIVMWCIGNEVPNQGVKGEAKTAKWLQDICHRLDPSRPVTQGMDNPDAVVNNNFAAVMDIPGFNYRSHKFQENYEKLPQALILGSETSSALSARGVYKFPVTRKRMAKYPDHQASSYDVEHVAWGTLPDDEFIQYEFLPYNLGEFVWTGFDYLGEPTPYYSDWPSHSSLFGIIDLAGIPKDRYYLYRSYWNTEDPTLHILPHWTFPDRIGETTPVFVYTSYPEAELFINGVSQGRQKKNKDVTLFNTMGKGAADSLTRLQRYRLMWMDTKYEPGTIKVIAYDENGNPALSKEIHTASDPHHIELIPDRDTLHIDGKDLAFIRVRVVDQYGNLCPNSSAEMKFEVSGVGTYRAAANGKTTSLELFHEPHMEVFNGELTLIVQSTTHSGKIDVRVKSPNLPTARLILQAQ